MLTRATLAFCIITLSTVFLMVININSHPFCVKTETILRRSTEKCNYFQTLEIRHFKDNSSHEEIFLESQRLEIEATHLYKSIDSAVGLEQFVPAKGGKPILNLILTTWGAGGYYLADLLNVMPGNFYNFQPLNFLPNESHIMNEIILKSLNCDFEDDNLNIRIDFNTRFFDFCELHNETCQKVEFVEQLCQLFPMQTMKTVEVDLDKAAELLKNESINLRIVYFVRDPIRMFYANPEIHDCWTHFQCKNIELLCKTLNSNAKLVADMTQNFPRTFKVVHYEEFVANPYEVTKELMRFFGLAYNMRIHEFLNSHPMYKTPYIWAKNVTYSDILKLQNECQFTMNTFGYSLVQGEHDNAEQTILGVYAEKTMLDITDPAIVNYKLNVKNIPIRFNAFNETEF